VSRNNAVFSKALFTLYGEYGICFCSRPDNTTAENKYNAF
jgi:hypothetical protein